MVKEVPVEVEREHVRCIQCTHGTRDKGEPGKVYCMRMGCQMMPKAYCSMAELDTGLVIRDKVQQAEELLNRSADIMSKYHDAYNAYQDHYRSVYGAYQSQIEEERAYRDLLETQLYDMKKQYSRNLADHVRGR